ncbi:MAG: methyltransferase domain-containing protein [Gaiella sp.]
MITRARLRLRRASNVDLHVTSGCDVACLTDGSADFAFSFVVFQHVPSRDAVVSTIRDVHRVLRPGSLFKFQLQGSQDAGYLAAEKDTWLGATFTQDELDLVAAACGFDVLGAAGAGTQYFWQWWRRR